MHSPIFLWFFFLCVCVLKIKFQVAKKIDYFCKALKLLEFLPNFDFVCPLLFVADEHDTLRTKNFIFILEVHVRK